MAEQAAAKTATNTYRLQGLTCASCAAKFEKNVQHIDGVIDAKVNFGASKLSVTGETTIADLEKAGAFDGIQVRKEYEPIDVTQTPFWKVHANVILSAFLLAAGWLLGEQYGEGHLLSVSAYALSIVAGGYSLFLTGLKNLLSFTFDMKTLMTIAIIGAAIIGEWGEGATVVILFAISEALERYSMEKARRSISSLMDIAPKEASIKRNGHEMVLNVRDITIGDIMIIKPGQKIAMDGEVISGRSSVNEAAITGESVPADKTTGDEVFAGTLNTEGSLEVRVTKRVNDTTIAKIIHLVEEAQAERAPSQAFIDTFAKYYTPAIMVIALLVAVVPPLMLGGDWSEWVYQGLAVLVVGCPCALVVSTPVSIVTAIGNAARNGVLIKGGIFLEEAGSLKAIAFDKTGTLTKGKPAVTDIWCAEGVSEQEMLANVAALENLSQHPLASAILKKADHLPFQSIQVSDFTSLTGRGVKGSISGQTLYAGSPELFTDHLNICLTPALADLVRTHQNNGKTVIAVGTDQSVLMLIAVADEVRETSGSVIEKLHRLGIKKTVMLTGDNQGTARAIGAAVGVSDVKAGLMPEEKLTCIKELRSQYGKTAMVGDGVNDAPALAASTVGIAMGGAGTDTALETADIALMADDLKKLPFTIQLSRRTLAVIKQNITFSIGIKLLALLLVVPGWLTLWIAIFADMGATLLVTLNSLRLMRVKDNRE
ncbi:heavy metal translocating P-type ATPase [Fictibacillus iocasae]|uniref:Cd(2+)-exporting ATPase n=1 Tax=Fictibacillus iocasae TaxID=2715437 RepID=A0ABW2NQS4_9BACL